MQYFRVRNLEKYQHYKDRNPTWIKLYASILTDVEFNSMKRGDQLDFIKLILLASQNGNQLVYQSGTIAGHICAPKRFKLVTFLDNGLIEIIDDTKKSASKMIAPINIKNINNINNINQKDKRLSADSQKPESTAPVKFDQKKHFETAWAEYPRKLGKKAAWNHYRASVKASVDHSLVMLAIVNYRVYADAMGYDYQHGSTWFNNWQDHINPHDIKAKDPPKTTFEKERDVIDDWAKTRNGNNLGGIFNVDTEPISAGD